MMLKAWNRLVKILLLPDDVMGRSTALAGDESESLTSPNAKPLKETATR